MKCKYLININLICNLKHFKYNFEEFEPLIFHLPDFNKGTNKELLYITLFLYRAAAYVASWHIYIEFNKIIVFKIFKKQNNKKCISEINICSKVSGR